MHTFFRNALRTLGISGLIMAAGATSALAAAPQFDTGVDIAQVEKPYDYAQAIEGSIFDSRSIYGKLDDASAADIYAFTADKDGEQTFSLLVHPEPGVATPPRPYLFIMDPTDATTAEQVGLPIPAENYHIGLITPTTADTTHRESATLQSYSVVAEQKLKLQKDVKYYFVVVDQFGQPSSYVIKTGTGKTWTAGDFFKSFGGWVQIQFDTFGGVNPFNFNVSTFVLLLFLMGFAILLGTFVVEQTLTFLANRSRSAAYLLIKMQPFSRILYWASLWITAIGGYLYFDRVIGFVGVPFALLITFIILVISLLVYTLKISPKLVKLDVSGHEAVIGWALRKKLFFSFLVSMFSLGAFTVFLAMLLQA